MYSVCCCIEGACISVNMRSSELCNGDECHVWLGMAELSYDTGLLLFSVKLYFNCSDISELLQCVCVCVCVCVWCVCVCVRGVM